ncbi:hypothetical protein THAOC_26347, partial [Thalassiosira oceanica]
PSREKSRFLPKKKSRVGGGVTPVTNDDTARRTDVTTGRTSSVERPAPSRSSPVDPVPGGRNKSPSRTEERPHGGGGALQTAVCGPTPGAEFVCSVQRGRPGEHGVALGDGGDRGQTDPPCPKAASRWVAHGARVLQGSIVSIIYRSDVYAGYIWKWADGNGDTIDRVYTGEESDDLEVQAILNKVTEMTAHRAKEKDGGEDEPTSIFGFVCGANMCGQVV